MLLHHHNDEEAKEGFYEQLQNVIDKVSKGGICIVMGDLNAKVGKMEFGRHQM